MHALLHRNKNWPLAFRLGLEKIAERYIRPLYEASDIGVLDRRFVKEGKGVIESFSRDELVVAETGTRYSEYSCIRCYGMSVREINCSRPVFDRTIFGEKRGTLHWHIPVCDVCDLEGVSLDLTDPILAYHGKRRHGFRDLPDQLLKFFDARYERAS